MLVIVGLLIAAAGGILFLKMKIPAGAMIGALAFVAVYNIITGYAEFPSYIKTASQILTGTFVGLSIRSDVLQLLKKLIVPAVMIAGGLMFAGILIGFLMFAITDYDLVTCLLSSAPGGIVDMALIGMDMGADSSVMAVMHLVRLLGIICLWPPLSKIIIKRVYKNSIDTQKANPDKSDSDNADDSGNSPLELRDSIKLNSLTIGVGIIGGIIGFFLQIPAGVMLFSMAAVGVMNVKTGKAYMTPAIRKAAQMAAGAMVGQSFGFEQLMSMGEMIIPALTIILCYLVVSVFLTWILYKKSGLDLLSAMYSGLPAGAADMALIAADMGVKGPQVAILHMARLVLVIALFPQIVYILARVFGMM